MTKNRTPTPVYLDPGMHSGLEVKGLRQTAVAAYFSHGAAKAVYPANTKHLYNICTMLDQRRRRWDDVVQMLYKSFVSAGYIVVVVVVFYLLKLLKLYIYGFKYVLDQLEHQQI